MMKLFWLAALSCTLTAFGSDSFSDADPDQKSKEELMQELQDEKEKNMELQKKLRAGSMQTQKTDPARKAQKRKPHSPQ